MERNCDLIDGNARIGETRFDRLLEGDALFHRAHTRPLNQAYSSFDRVEALQRDVEKRSSDPSLHPLPRQTRRNKGCVFDESDLPFPPSPLPSPLADLRDVASVGTTNVSREDSINVARRFPDIALHGCVNNGDLSVASNYQAGSSRGTKPRSSCPKSLTRSPDLNIQCDIRASQSPARGWFSPIV